MRLSQIAATAIEEAVGQIAHDRIGWEEQDASRATFAAKIEKADSVLDLRKPAPAIACRIHAVSPKPGGAVSLISAAGDETVLKISRAGSCAYESGDRPTPGTISQTDPATPLRIATGAGWLIPLVLQRPGGKALPIADFLRGFEIPDGARLQVPNEDEAENS